jgi:vesicle-fusing ATPase
MLTAATKIKLAVKPGNKMVLLEESDERPPIFDPNWSFADMGIGGLDAEFGVLFRRAFASRLFPPTVIESLGIKHVKGMDCLSRMINRLTRSPSVCD